MFSGVLRTIVPGQEFELTVSAALSADLLRSSGTTVIQGQISLESSATNRNPLTIPVFGIIPPESAIVPAIIPLPVAPLAQSSNSASSRFVKDNVNDASQTLLGYVPKEVPSSTLLYHADASETLDLRVVLPLKPGVDDLIKQFYDPKSPIFHHFLTPKQFAEQFGPSALDSDPVKQFLLSQGFSISEQSADGSVLHVTGPVPAVEGAFKLHINHYTKTDGTPFFAPDADPTIPIDVAGKIAAIGGMNNLHKFRHPLPQKIKNRLSTQGGTGPCDIYINTGCMAPNDVKTAYNLNKVPSNGSGQIAAVFELDGYTPSDISQYDSYFNIPDVNLQNILIDNFDGTPSGTIGSDEVTGDIELLTGIASGLNTLMVYEGDNNAGNAWTDEWKKIADDDIAKVIRCSWGQDELDEDASSINSDSQIFKQMATQGQAVFVASGDCGAYGAYDNNCENTTILNVDEPADLQYATGVGITKLTINSDGTYNNESASTQSGGGISFYVPIPSYQQGMVSAASLGSTTMRNVPDVAINGDFSTQYSVYVGGEWGAFEGSSAAAPIWAAFAVIVNQGRASANQSALGFMNPVLYQIAQSSHYANEFSRNYNRSQQ